MELQTSTVVTGSPLHDVHPVSAGSGSGRGLGEAEIQALASRLALEYAEIVRPEPLDPSLSLREDLGIESLALVSLTLRFGDELGVDLIDLGIEVGTIKTLADLINLGLSLSRSARFPQPQEMP